MRHTLVVLQWIWIAMIYLYQNNFNLKAYKPECVGRERILFYANTQYKFPWNLVGMLENGMDSLRNKMEQL